MLEHSWFVDCPLSDLLCCPQAYADALCTSQASRDIHDVLLAQHKETARAAVAEAPTPHVPACPAELTGWPICVVHLYRFPQVEAIVEVTQRDTIGTDNPQLARLIAARTPYINALNVFQARSVGPVGLASFRHAPAGGVGRRFLPTGDGGADFDSPSIRLWRYRWRCFGA